tara:strand:+ start:3397 stop:3582 length:186 start_codon:yes stop_codon:yes gene_type:complete
MRVPTIGQPLDERRIVREGYRIAERMLADYRDPPGLIEIAATWLSMWRQRVLEAFRVIIRD